jgi:hypothetical protein
MSRLAEDDLDLARGSVREPAAPGGLARRHVGYGTRRIRM